MVRGVVVARGAQVRERRTGLAEGAQDDVRDPRDGRDQRGQVGTVTECVVETTRMKMCTVIGMSTQGRSTRENSEGCR
ncbi:MAG TPA: hypothetical protein DCP37_15240 [Dehalococcoidia bacterium]|nr:hypothetical protein [Dehalococcoidia bacterium]